MLLVAVQLRTIFIWRLTTIDRLRVGQPLSQSEINQCKPVTQSTQNELHIHSAIQPQLTSLSSKPDEHDQ